MCLRGSRSRPNVPPHSSSSATLTRGSCCVLMWQLEGWTSLRWTGSCSTTPQMTPRYQNSKILVATGQTVMFLLTLTLVFVSAGVHPQGGQDGQRHQRQRPRAPDPPARGARLPPLPQTSQGNRPKPMCSCKPTTFILLQSCRVLCLYPPSVLVVQVPLNEFEFSWSKISDIQSQVSFLHPQLHFML